MLIENAIIKRIITLSLQTLGFHENDLTVCHWLKFWWKWALVSGKFFGTPSSIPQTLRFFPNVNEHRLYFHRGNCIKNSVSAMFL